MSRYRVLVVDDEPLARATLVDLLGRDPDIELIGECGDGARALVDIRRLHPDIVLLDIEMPERSGLDVIRALAPEELPAFVLVTAYGRYATRAFELEALDYVLKPFSDERLAAALGRAKRRVRERRVSELAAQLAALASEPEEGAAGSKYLSKLAVPHAGRTLLVAVAEIRWIEAEDYYVRLHTHQGSHLLRASLSALEERLDPERFLRIHRNALVNVEVVREVTREPKGARVLVLAGGERLRVSRARASAVEARLLPRLGAR